jgi:LuxR family transcriptional regulator, quorum-sensing system regulator BjaR1
MNIQDFIMESTETYDTASLTRSYMKFIRQFGYESFVFADLSPVPIEEKNRNFGLMARYPRSWLERYTSRNYALSDPLYLCAHHINSPISFTEAKRIYRRFAVSATDVLGEAADFGLRTGMGIPVRTISGRLYGFGVSTPEKDSRSDLQARSLIQLASFHICTLYQEITYSGTDRPLIVLSPREKETLSWIAAGKNKSEIADLLMISLSSVKRYCERIFLKLQVNNLPAAVAKAIVQGLIHP